MAYTVLLIANKALGRIGGAGDQLSGDAFLPNLNGTDKVTAWVNTVYPQVRQKVIGDLALVKCPFREAVKYADLGDDIKQNDIDITSIAIGATPTFTVTVTTDEDHELTTGDTVMLFEIEGTGGIETLNGSRYTVTVVNDTSFTLNNTTGTANWEHTEDTGIVSHAPEIGGWKYCFNLPSDCFAVSRVLDEVFSDIKTQRREYRFEVVLNKDSDGFVLLTNNLTNKDGDSAFIEYVIDQDNVALFTDSLVECIATLLAAELCPIIGKDLETRQKILLEYETLTKPRAQAFNQLQLDNEVDDITGKTDYLGGRTSTLV